MSRRIIRQPNGLYAQWSSIVDDFVMLDATRQDIVKDWVEHETAEINKRVNEIVDAIERGEKSIYNNMTFEDAIERIREIHGDEAESLRMLHVTTEPPE